MHKLTPLELAQITSGVWIPIPNHINWSGFAHDTRLINRGEVFVALETENADGHRFLDDAKTKFASAALVSQHNPHIPLPQLLVPDTLKALHEIALAHRNHFSGTLVGITGSCGKTTSKDLLSEFLSPEITHKSHKNFNNTLGVPLSILGLNENHRFGVFEAGINQPGEMNTLASLLTPDYSLITNIQLVHAERLLDTATIAQEKVQLAERGTGPVFIDPSAWAHSSFKDLGSRVNVVHSSDTSVVDAPNAITYTLDAQSGQLSILGDTFSLPKVSRGMASNFALAIALARDLNVPPSTITRVLSEWKPSEYRGQVVRSPNNSLWFVDCYNSNPSALSDAVEHFQTHFAEPGKNLYIIGSLAELGPDAAGQHARIAETLPLESHDAVITTGEFAEDLARGFSAAGIASVSACENLQDIRDRLDTFSGKVFIKGSKPCKLWELLPQSFNLIN